jgi:tetraacyldisaccharide 4'-kinase
LTPLYHLIVVIKRLLYDWGWLRQRKLPAPVISVGSVSAGGAGKTPFVVMLARLLDRRGYAVSILTRGYGRTSQVIERVAPGGDPVWHGDEPVLMAQQSGASVFAGADRYEAGLLAGAERSENRIAVHLLDDGFQHLRLARSVDIVLLTLEDTEDVLLPAGNLREPVSAVGKANIVVVREEEAASLFEELEALREEGHAFLVWTIRRTLSLLEGPETALPTFPLAFCGIARPDNFTRMLTKSRYEPMETMAFADHHRYESGDMMRLVKHAHHIGANGLVTTEKDAVKITQAMRAQLREIGPLIVARLKVELLNEKESLGQLVAMVNKLDRRRNRPIA